MRSTPSFMTSPFQEGTESPMGHSGYPYLVHNLYFFPRFEIAIFVLIFLNMVSMGIEHYNQSRVITFTLEICNALFTTIFSLGKSLTGSTGKQKIIAGKNIRDIGCCAQSVSSKVLLTGITFLP